VRSSKGKVDFRFYFQLLDWFLLLCLARLDCGFFKEFEFSTRKAKGRAMSPAFVLVVYQRLVAGNSD